MGSLTFSSANKAGGRESGKDPSGNNLSMQVDGLMGTVEGLEDTAGSGGEGERDGGRDNPTFGLGWKRGGEGCSVAFNGTDISVGAQRS